MLSQLFSFSFLLPSSQILKSRKRYINVNKNIIFHCVTAVGHMYILVFLNQNNTQKYLYLIARNGNASIAFKDFIIIDRNWTDICFWPL